MDWSTWIQQQAGNLLDKAADYQTKKLELEQVGPTGTRYVEGKPTTTTPAAGGALTITPTMLLIGGALLLVVMMRD